MFDVKQWWPTVVFTCGCNPRAPQVLALVGTTAAVECPACQTKYQIDQFEYNRADDKIAIALGQRLPSRLVT